LRWRSEEREWECPVGRAPLAHLWSSEGHGSYEEGHKLSGERLRADLGLLSGGLLSLVVADEDVIRHVPGSLAHRGVESIARRWIAAQGVNGRFLLLSLENHAVSVVGLALERLRRQGRVEGDQGERGGGWTRCDAAWQERDEQQRAREQHADRMYREVMERQKEALAALAALGIHANACGGKVTVVSEDMIRLCALATRAAS
jgi:hypothetical protein